MWSRTNKHAFWLENTLSYPLPENLSLEQELSWDDVWTDTAELLLLRLKREHRILFSKAAQVIFLLLLCLLIPFSIQIIDSHTITLDSSFGFWLERLFAQVLLVFSVASAAAALFLLCSFSHRPFLRMLIAWRDRRTGKSHFPLQKTVFVFQPDSVQQLFFTAGINAPFARDALSSSTLQGRRLSHFLIFSTPVEPDQRKVLFVNLQRLSDAQRESLLSPPKEAAAEPIRLKLSCTAREQQARMELFIAQTLGPSLKPLKGTTILQFPLWLTVGLFGIFVSGSILGDALKLLASLSGWVALIFSLTTMLFFVVNIAGMLLLMLVKIPIVWRVFLRLMGTLFLHAYGKALRDTNAIELWFFPDHLTVHCFKDSTDDSPTRSFEQKKPVGYLSFGPSLVLSPKGNSSAMWIFLDTEQLTDALRKELPTFLDEHWLYQKMNSIGWN